MSAMPLNLVILIGELIDWLIDWCLSHWTQFTTGHHGHLSHDEHTVKPVLRGHLWNKEKVPLLVIR